MRILLVLAALVVCLASAHKMADPPPQQQQPVYGAPPPPPPPPPAAANYCFDYTPHGGGMLKTYCAGGMRDCTNAMDKSQSTGKYVAVSGCSRR